LQQRSRSCRIEPDTIRVEILRFVDVASVPRFAVRVEPGGSIKVAAMAALGATSPSAVASVIGRICP